MNDWLTIERGSAPLLIAIPHAGIDLADVTEGFRSPWLARRDADWWVDRLYAMAHDLGATTVRTAISRTVIDCNRDPSGASLYPGQATTELCPTTTFDGEPLYPGVPPSATEIARRRALWFDPYHQAITDELGRLRARNDRVVLYDAHSIRSHVPRLFDGALPLFNIGTNDGATCAPELEDAVSAVCAASGHSYVRNDRFKGGWTTRHYGEPQVGIHAIQMELAMRGYMREPTVAHEANWPAPLDAAIADNTIAVLTQVLEACLAFAQQKA